MIRFLLFYYSLAAFNKNSFPDFICWNSKDAAGSSRACPAGLAVDDTGAPVVVEEAEVLEHLNLSLDCAYT